ncbi:MAG: radical SAM protein [Myxococcales bacterium]|nr:radical SAM protein [Myxococcales bacterium]MCB9553122.1 radical SAM protein [Myxococcales bacterium]
MTSHPPPTFGQLAACFDNTRLELFVLPTEQCNFRCTYCYEDFEIGRMSDETARGVMALLDRRAPELRRLTIRWFGGEPLIACDRVEQISAHAQRLAARHGIAYRGTMTTNGYRLGPARLARLVGLGVDRYQVSLDGPGAVHDRTRRRRGGQGSFDRIWENLVAARESAVDFGVLLRIHLTPENLDAMPDFLVAVRETLLVDPRFAVRFMPIADLGGPNAGAIAVLDRETVARVMAVMEGVEGAADEGARPLEICYAAKANSLVVRADGRIAKCTVALADRRNDVGRLTAAGEVLLDAGGMDPWLRGWAAGDGGALHCPMEALPAADEGLVVLP